MFKMHQGVFRYETSCYKTFIFSIFVNDGIWIPLGAWEKKIHATPKFDFKKTGYWKSGSYITGSCNVG